MAQRRNASSSGRGDGPSDLDDTKALAAQARSQTGGPVLKPNAAELSGVRPRRDSVIGARLTPPPRASSSDMPNWIWGVFGCLGVLLVGFVGFFLLARTGKLEALVGDLVPAVTTVAEPAPASPPPAAEPVAPPPTEPPPPPAAAERQAPAQAPAKTVQAERAPEPADEPPARAAPAAAPAPEAHHAAGHGPAPGPGKHVAKSTEAPAAEEPDNGDSANAAETKAPARPARAAAPAAKPAGEEDSADEDTSPPGQDAVETALDALASRVRGCFVKYQIKGTARVKLVATPAGTAESVNVTGEFEDTPTGLCVEAVVGGAKLPAFKGAPLKLSQSYQLR